MYKDESLFIGSSAVVHCSWQLRRCILPDSRLLYWTNMEKGVVAARLIVFLISILPFSLCACDLKKKFHNTVLPLIISRKNN